MAQSSKPLFVYGTLMFEEVVFSLLGRKLEAVPAVLMGYSRYAIQREPGGARGPVIFLEEAGLVNGMALLDIDLEASQAIDLFEDAASGYVKSAVTVLVDGGRKVQAETYVGTDILRPMVAGVWDVERFRDRDLPHYLNERIPALKSAWKEKGTNE